MTGSWKWGKIIQIQLAGKQERVDTDLWDIFGQQLRMPSEIQILKQLAHLKWANSSIVVRSHILSDDERSKQPQSKSQFVDRKKKK